MAAPEQSGTVKKETMLMVAAATLVIGFLSGIVFSVYKMGPPHDHQDGAPPTAIQAPADGGISAKDSADILALEREVAVNKNNVEAWTHLGHKYFDTNQPQKAIDAYNRALALEPNVPDTWTDMGVMYRRVGQPIEALKAFDRARQLNPTHEQSRFNRGVVFLYDLKEPESAIEAWQELLAINPQVTAPNGQPLAEVIAEVQKKVGTLKPQAPPAQ